MSYIQKGQHCNHKNAFCTRPTKKNVSCY
uniref:Uncharacterized protein n=1 Tax=Anguilla anguilla TaxID=7936 RepID=A0A0E9XL78_ANGAN